MKYIENNPHHDESLKPVVAAGYHNSGWDIAFPALQSLKLRVSGKRYSEWLELVFSDSEIDQEMSYVQPLIPTIKDIDFIETETLFSDSRNIWLLDFLANKFPQARFILFYTNAETALESALSKGVKPESFMLAWYQANQAIVRFQRQHRDRSVLFNAESVACNSEEFHEACQRLDLSYKEDLESSLSIGDVFKNPIERLLASQFLQHAPDNLMLQQELEASAIPLGDVLEGYSSNSESVFDAYYEQKKRTADFVKELNKKSKFIDEMTSQLRIVDEKHEKSTQENELLLLQLRQVQDELESVFDDSQKLKLENQEYESGIKSLESRLESTNQSIADQKIELENRLESVNQGIEDKKIELEENKLTIEKTEERLDAQKAASEAIQDELNQSMGNIKLLKEEKKDAEQENKILLMQIQQVQEELEHYFTKYQEVTQKEIDPETKKDVDNSKKPRQNNPRKNNETGSKSPHDVKLTFRQKSAAKRKKRKAKASAREQEQEKISLIKNSGLFDGDWYQKEYPDVAEAGLDPVKHYLRYGANEDRDPSAHFCTHYYMGSNPDIPRDEINPLVHYIRFGRDEGRLTKNYGFNH